MIFYEYSASAIGMAFAMFWEIFWALALGFWLSAIVQAVVSKREIVRLLPDDSPRTLWISCGLGAASSSCSYAAVALARSIFRKGGDFTAAIAFMLASTNLVMELGIVMWVLMGWHFALAEFIGAPIMVFLLAFIFRIFLKPKMLDEVRNEAKKGRRGAMEGHADMGMSISEGPFFKRFFSASGFTAISHYFFMDWAAIWKDIALGILIAGALAAWVPNHFWQNFFLTGHPILGWIWGPLVGPVVSMLSFVCSIGNVPLAAVLWNGGISFGGVIAFIYADLIILPILNIYRKYYGKRMAIFLALTLYASMVGAAFMINLLFQAFKLVPATRHALVIVARPSWNYTAILNLIFLGLSLVLFLRFLKTGGPEMLRAMDAPVSIKPHGFETAYTCPMHSDVLEANPGHCPRCHMTLRRGS